MFHRLISSPLLAWLAPRITTAPQVQSLPPLRDEVDLERLMGIWYPIATLAPTQEAREARACNTVEEYRLLAPDRIALRVRYRDRCYDGRERIDDWDARVRANTGNAIWELQRRWAVKCERHVLWLAPDYSQFMIGCARGTALSYLSRTPQVSCELYRGALHRARQLGYDAEAIRAIPRRGLIA